MAAGSGPILGSAGPSGRQRGAAKRKRNIRIGVLVVGGLVGFFFLSLFLVDTDEVDKEISKHHELHVTGGKAASSKHHQRPNHSLVKQRPIAQMVPHKTKIFIYGDVVPASLSRNLRGKEVCWNGYSATEVLLPELVASTSTFTTHGELADFYLVPIVPECYLTTEMHKGTEHRKAQDNLNILFSQAMDSVQARYPYWANSEGRDHLFIFPSERGAAVLTADNLQRIKKSILITGLQQRSLDWTHFNRAKDIVVPPAMSIYTLEKQTDPGEPRTHLLYFRGLLPGIEDQGVWGLRANLATQLRKEPGVLFRESSAGCGRDCSLAEMATSTFCLAPDGGVEGWSLRIFDSILRGCIPVIIGDAWELPFQQLLDWSKFSVKILQKEADEVVEILRGIPQSEVEAKAVELQRAAKTMRWRPEWSQGDALDTFLSMLDSRVRFMRNSPYRYWRKPVQYG